jgi:putative tryptophan/tyrosine transport system substrate-binding protein
MRRRDFITVMVCATALPYAARAQRTLPPVIGFMSARTPEDSASVLQAFHKGLKEEGGFADGENVRIEYRWGRGNYASMPALASELVERHVDILVAVGGDASARAAKAATSTIPIVFAMSSDPVEAGLVESINRPGGNATGCLFSSISLEAKRLNLMREIVPGDSLFGVMVNPKYPMAVGQARELEAAATKIGRAIFIVQASDDAELKAAFATLLQRHVGGLVVASDPYFDAQRARIIGFAAENRLPAIYQFRDYAVDGGLISYGPSITEMYRQIGIDAGRILKGAKPSDLPVVQPTKFDFVINLKTAKVLGLTFPPGLLAIADEVIE